METQALNLSGHMDYEKMIRHIALLEETYPDLSVTYIGATILDRAIPMLTLGNPAASKSVLYLGGVGGGDSATSALLLRFAGDYCEFLKSGRRMYSVNLPYLFANRRICVIPMLNCDGCSIRHNHGGDNCPAFQLVRERLIRMNSGNALADTPSDTLPCDPPTGDTFANWEANARGVDLRLNFSEGFGEGFAKPADAPQFGAPTGYCGTSPESEPESASLCNAVRMHNGSALLLRLHMDDNTLTIPTSPEPIPRIRTVARILSRMSGTPTSRKPAPSGSPEDWFAANLRQPAFALGCHYPDTPYPYLRELLFTAPLLV